MTALDMRADMPYAANTSSASSIIYSSTLMSLSQVLYISAAAILTSSCPVPTEPGLHLACCPSGWPMMALGRNLALHSSSSLSVFISGRTTGSIIVPITPSVRMSTGFWSLSARSNDSYTISTHSWTESGARTIILKPPLPEALVACI